MKEQFKLICPICKEEGEVMSYSRKEKNKLIVTHICPYCGYCYVDTHFMYE